MRTDSSQKDYPQYLKFWLIPIFMLCTALVCLPFLPNIIPINWDANWNPNSWGTKWWVLSIPLLDALLFPFIEFLLVGLLGRYPGFLGSRVESDPKGFFYLCFFILSLACYALEIFMVAESFYGSVHTPRFLLTTLCGAALVAAAFYAKRKKRTALILGIAGVFLFLTNLIP